MNYSVDLSLLHINDKIEFIPKYLLVPIIDTISSDAAIPLRAVIPETAPIATAPVP